MSISHHIALFIIREKSGNIYTFQQVNLFLFCCCIWLHVYAADFKLEMNALLSVYPALLIPLSCILSFTLLILQMSLRYHCIVWRTWRKEHQRVHVVMETKDSENNNNNDDMISVVSSKNSKLLGAPSQKSPSSSCSPSPKSLNSFAPSWASPNSYSIPLQAPLASMTSLWWVFCPISKSWVLSIITLFIYSYFVWEGREEREGLLFTTYWTNHISTCKLVRFALRC